MLLKSIVLALRQLQKNPATSVFNIVGLAIGITSFSLLLFYIQKEKSYDRHNVAIDQLYRVVNNYRVEKDHNITAWIPPALASNILGAAEPVRMFRYRSPVVMVDRTNDKNFTEPNSIWADGNVFNVFTFDFVKGKSEDALTRPNSMVITESTAAKYFGDIDPIGKVLSDITMNADFEITGVVRDLPPTAHFKADFLCSLSTLPKLWGTNILDQWGNSFLYTYIRGNEGTSKEQLETAINEIASKHIPASEQYDVHFELQPAADIHLGSNVLNEWQPNSDIRYIYILTAVAGLILLVSAINYVNLWIARSERRMKEIGIRQAIGGSKGNLRTQFTIESITHVVLALALSATLVSVVGPLVKSVLGEDILIRQSQPMMWVYIFAGMIGFMFVVMLYPARIISRIRPALAIKGRQTKSKGVSLWEGLIAFQILTTACLITGTLLIDRQLSFMKDQPLGYDADHLVNVSQMSNIPLRNRLKEVLEKDSRVKSATGVSHLPGETLYMSGYRIFNHGAVENVLWQRIHTDYDFLDTYQIPVVAGRDFSRAVASDSSNFIINEAAVRLLGLTPENAVGIEINSGLAFNGKIIGVMKDFHFKTLHSGIEPLIIHIVPDRIRMLTVNIGGSDAAGTLRWMEDQWKLLQPEEPFVYTTMAGANERYRFEEKFAKVIVFFTMIVFLLSVSGLVSLNIYIANLRRREIGIRKILGAETSDVLLTLSKRFALITTIGFALSVPLSWYALDAWLHGFAYKVDLTVGLFIAGGVITFVLSMVSISLPSWRAASENAVSVLKAGE